MFRRPFLFRCPRCHELVRVVRSGRSRPGEAIEPAVYSCGHRLAELISSVNSYTPAATARPGQFRDDLLAASLVELISSVNSYTPAATVDPGRFRDDLLAAVKLAERPEYIIEPADHAAWLAADYQATLRELLADVRRRFEAGPDGQPPPIIITDV